LPGIPNRETSCGVSVAREAAARFIWYASLAPASCGVAVALRRAIFVAAEDALPMGTLFWVGCREK